MEAVSAVEPAKFIYSAPAELLYNSILGQFDQSFELLKGFHWVDLFTISLFFFCQLYSSEELKYKIIQYQYFTSSDTISLFFHISILYYITL